MKRLFIGVLVLLISITFSTLAMAEGIQIKLPNGQTIDISSLNANERQHFLESLGKINQAESQYSSYFYRKRYGHN